MSSPIQKIKKISGWLFIYVAILFVLFLTSLNINNFLAPKKILGVQANLTVDSKNTAYWNNFLNKNPDYIQGWVEIGRMDKVKEINPNYLE